MTKSIYILGTGLSHNGSAVLLKDGKVCVAIEKERISRIKHDGGNDSLAIQYCLDAEGISLGEIDLVVQCANFEVPNRNNYGGKRVFNETDQPPLYSISHHLAHAYSAAGTCPYSESAIMVIDGCGSPYEQCMDLDGVDDSIIFHPEKNEVFCEKDSFYFFDGQTVHSVVKDFSEMTQFQDPLNLPTTKHSIGGFYATISRYVFGNMDDVGKLMGLAPFGKEGGVKSEAFKLKDGRIFLKEDWQLELDKPSEGYSFFKSNFEYYADIAFWAQQQVEKAIHYCIRNRMNLLETENLCYTGGVALNAVANGKLLDNAAVKNLYLEPAAGDNGLALGCAFYGWMEILKKQKVAHDGNTCFGKKYLKEDIVKAIEKKIGTEKYSWSFMEDDVLYSKTAEKLQDGKVVAWFKGGSEFGPRALGHRSILAHPGREGMADHINRDIKFREDFRPFAPVVLPELSTTYFKSGRKSPYMILVDQCKDEYRDLLKNVCHVNGSSRVQTVEEDWNTEIHTLLKYFQEESGFGLLLNTSMNKKGMPMVERPEEALELFMESALDVLVLENCLIEKETDHLETILGFLSELGIVVRNTELKRETFLPGLTFGDNAILMDRDKLKFPGDILHEAGHLAVVTPEKRQRLLNEPESCEKLTEGEEIGAILWSYAALKFLDIDPEYVFHSDGYKNDSQWIVNQFRNGDYFGLPFLEWTDMAYGDEGAIKEGVEAFPNMKRWLRLN
jgi:carbamoyltransferase